MRIIKNPNPVKEVEKECEHCRCIFAYSNGDIKTFSYSNDIIGPGYRGYLKKYVQCPNCGSELVIEEKSIGGEMIPIDVDRLLEDGEIKPESDIITIPSLENSENDKGRGNTGS